MANTMESVGGSQDDSQSEREKIEDLINAYEATRVLWFKGAPQHKSNEACIASWIDVARRANLSGM